MTSETPLQIRKWLLRTEKRAKDKESKIIFYKVMIHYADLRLRELESEVVKEEDLLKCPKCGKNMKNIEDPKTGKMSKYLFGCECGLNKTLAKG